MNVPISWDERSLVTISSQKEPLVRANGDRVRCFFPDDIIQKNMF